MIIRNCIVVVGLWTLLAAPLLCGVGVLGHPRICEESTECHDERQCSTDPCQILAFRSTSQVGKWRYSAGQAEQLNPPALVDDFVVLFEAQPELIVYPDRDLPEMVVFDRSLPLLC